MSKETSKIIPTSATKPTPILIRDDDLSLHTDYTLFKNLHQQFIEKNQVHTVAVIMKDLWLNQAIFYYLATAPLLDIGLHGWEHLDYSLLDYEDCYFDLQKAIHYWEENSFRMTGQCKKIDTFFAPWNKEGEGIKQACKDLGLDFCNVKKGMWNGYQVKSFHWWADNFKL